MNVVLSLTEQACLHWLAAAFIADATDCESA